MFYKDSTLNLRKLVDEGASGVQLVDEISSQIKKTSGLASKYYQDVPDPGKKETDVAEEIRKRYEAEYKKSSEYLATRDNMLASLEKGDVGVEPKSTKGLGSRPTDDEVIDLSPSGELLELEETSGKLPSGADVLLQDDDFMGQLAMMQNKYPGLTQQEIFDVIKGESSFRTDVVNSGGYKGLFQIGKTAAKEAGIDYKNLEDMSAADQLKAYDKYLERWGYDGTYSLGVLQAAPSFRNASDDTVIYTKKKDPKVFKLNPSWFDEDGNATVASINKYYGY